MIFIVRKRALGDVMWIEPFLQYIISRHPGKSIFIYTKYPAVFENYPYPKLRVEDNPKWYIKIWIRILNKLKFKNCYVLDDVYEADTHKHFLKAYYDKFGIKDGYMQYPSLKHLLNKEDVSKKKAIAFHINNTAPQLFRKIHGINWEVIFANVIEQGFEVQLLHAKGEPGLKDTGLPVKYFSGTLKELVNTINESAYFIGLDSAPSHIAAALKIPSIIFFGSVLPKYRHLENEFKGYFMQSYCEKAGCFHLQKIWEYRCLINDDQTIIPKCSIYTNAALMEAIHKLLKNYEVQPDAEN
jgi:ADP-heptose:LPS heptosyltransferase